MDARISDLRRHARRSGWTVSSVSASTQRKRAKIDLVASRPRGQNFAGVPTHERLEINVDSFNNTIYAIQLIGGRYVRDVRGVEHVQALLDAAVPEIV